MRLAREFKFQYADREDVTYRAKETDTGWYEISGTSFVTWYSPEDIVRYITEGAWLIKEIVQLREEEPPMESSDCILDEEFVMTGNINPNLLVSTKALTEPEYLPPDDIESELIRDYGINILDVQKFTQELPEYFIHVDADFFSVLSISDDSVIYVAKDVEQLTSIMQALRTLDKYRDRG